MKDLKNIQILTTGGTIEGIDYLDNLGIVNSTFRISDFLNHMNLNLDFTITEVCKKDSRTITGDDRKLLANNIKSSKTSKILITHGTYTMIETAKYLSSLNLNKSVILVGSFILGTNKNTDAPFNLGYALASLQNIEIGVYIAMNGQLFSYDNVEKNTEQNCFQTIS